MFYQYKPSLTLGFKNKYHISQNQNIARYVLTNNMETSQNAWGLEERGRGGGFVGETLPALPSYGNQKLFHCKEKSETREKNIDKCRPIDR